MKTEAENLPALFPESTSDGWAAVPSSGATLIKGKLIKFANGEFLLGDEVVNGRELAAGGVVTAWIRWEGGRPVEVRETTAGMRHPYRDELEWLDAAEWEKGLDGAPSDPWRDTRLVFFVDPETAEEFTISLSSFGGRSAVETLARQVAIVRSGSPRATPIVKLNVEKFKTKYGSRPKPKFEISSWVGAAPKVVATKTLAHEIEDELPF